MLVCLHEGEGEFLSYRVFVCRPLPHRHCFVMALFTETESVKQYRDGMVPETVSPSHKICVLFFG